MKTICLALCLLLAVASASNYKYDCDSDDIYTFDNDNFPHCQQDFDYVLVKFYSPSCPYSIKYAPQFAQAYKSLHGGAYNVAFGEVNIKTQSALRKKYSITSTPSTRLFVKSQNKWASYDGQRQSAPLVSWIKGQVDSYRNKH